MAQHLIVLRLNDDLGDIQSEADLKDFIDDLRSSTHAQLDARWFYDVDLLEDEED
jgi:hypothetical protein